MSTNKIKTVIAAAIIIMISLAFYVPNVSAMDTAAREFETACKKGTSNVTAVRYSVVTGTAATASGKDFASGKLVKDATGTLDLSQGVGNDCRLAIGVEKATAESSGGTATIKLDNGEIVSLTAAQAGDSATAYATLNGYKVRTVSTILSQFGTINRLVLGILPLLLLLTSFAYGALLVTGTGENISDSVKAEVGGLVVLQIVTSFLPSILQFLVTASGATDGQYGVTGDFGGIIDIIFGVIPIVMVVAIIALIGQRIYREASDRGMMSGAGLA